MPKFVNLLCKPKGLQLAYTCISWVDTQLVFAAHRQMSTQDAHSCHVAATRTNVSPGRAACSSGTYTCARHKYEHMFENLTHNKIVNLLCKPSARATFTREETPGQKGMVKPSHNTYQPVHKWYWKPRSQSNHRTLCKNEDQ